MLITGALACAGAAGAGMAAGLFGSARGPPASRRPLRAQRLRFAALAPDPGQPAQVAAWRAVFRAWLARIVAAGPGNREISAGLFIRVRAASVRVPGMAVELSVAGCGEAAAAACSPAGAKGPLIVCTWRRMSRV